MLDRDRLQRAGAPQEFAWAVRETGTFLLFLGFAEDLEAAKALPTITNSDIIAIIERSRVETISIRGWEFLPDHQWAPTQWE